MTDEQLAEIERRANAATPGPWIDLSRAYFERCKRDRRTHGNRWYHGSERASCPLALIVRDSVQGKPFALEDIPRRVDRYDLKAVFSLFWSSLPKQAKSMMEGFFRPEDAAFITHARTDVPALIAEVRRLRAALERIVSTFEATPSGVGPTANDALRTIAGMARAALAAGPRAGGGIV